MRSIRLKSLSRTVAIKRQTGRGNFRFARRIRIFWPYDVEKRVAQLAAVDRKRWLQGAMLVKRSGERGLKGFRRKKLERSDDVPNTLIQSFPIGKHGFVSKSVPPVIQSFWNTRLRVNVLRLLICKLERTEYLMH